MTGSVKQIHHIRMNRTNDHSIPCLSSRIEIRDIFNLAVIPLAFHLTFKSLTLPSIRHCFQYTTGEINILIGKPSGQF